MMSRNIHLRPLLAIRANCLECTQGSKKEVRECPSEECSLHHLRMGKNPKRAGVGNVVNLKGSSGSTTNGPQESRSSSGTAGGV